jgi:hypothetical protein
MFRCFVKDRFRGKPGIPDATSRRMGSSLYNLTGIPRSAMRALACATVNSP